jgi:hypothetical protein
MASEKFQQIIAQVIRGCPGAYNMSDDIVVVGRTREEHDSGLRKVIHCLSDAGLTVNSAKCKITQTSLN